MTRRQVHFFVDPSLTRMSWDEVLRYLAVRASEDKAPSYIRILWIEAMMNTYPQEFSGAGS